MKKKRKLAIIKDCNYDAQKYCINRGWIIYPKPNGNSYKVWYQRGHSGKYYMNGKEFDRDGSQQAIWDLYTKIYEHENKNK